MKIRFHASDVQRPVKLDSECEVMPKKRREITLITVTDPLTGWMYSTRVTINDYKL